MRDIFSQLETWSSQGETIALATVIQTWGSSPRQIGSKLAVIGSGTLCGSVSGGCVESAVVENAFKVLKNGKPRLLHFGVAEDTAWDVGLACGGTIEVFVKRFDPFTLDVLKRWLMSGHKFAIVTVIRGSTDLLGHERMIGEDGTVIGTPFGGEIDETAIYAAREALDLGLSRRLLIAEDPTLELFIDVTMPEPELVIVGGVHIAVALTQIAKVLGYRTTVIDPRTVFGNADRFPEVDCLISAFPEPALTQLRLTSHHAIVILSHDPKLDDPAVRCALQSPAFYVGALGSKATQRQRRDKLRADGMTDAQLDRLHGPIGLDLGGRTPEEIALAVMAEVVAVRNARVQVMVKRREVHATI